MSYIALIIAIKKMFDDRNITRICLFILALYTLVWFTCPSWTLPGTGLKIIDALLCLALASMIVKVMDSDN